MLRTVLLTAFVLALSLPALAALPPMSKEELEQNADLIVEATVREVEKAGPEKEDHCYTWQPFRARLTVDETRKGEKVPVIHVRYQTRVADEKDCVGGATSYSMKIGAQYELYLRRLEDGDYGFINWAGVNQIAEKGPPEPAPESPAPAPEPAPSPSPSDPEVVIPKAPEKNGGCACDLARPEARAHAGWRPLAVFLVLAAFAAARRRRSVFGVSLFGMCAVGCGPAEPAANPGAEPVPSALAVEVEPSPAEPTPSAEPPDTPTPTDPVSLKKACEGTHLDLRWMFESKACHAPAGAKKRAPEGALTTRVEPAELELAPGAGATAMVVIENATDASLELDVSLNCIVGSLHTSIVDQAGKRADIIHKCGHGSGCGGPSSRIVLDGGGDARIPFDVKAVVREEDADCDLGPEKPMAPGAYTVRAHMPFGPPEATGRLVVDGP